MARNTRTGRLMIDADATLQEALTEAKERLRSIYGDRLVRVILYGSRARGDARPDSDVDVLVVLRGPIDAYQEIKRLVRLETDLYDQFDLHVAFQPYDEVTFQDRRRLFIQNVQADGVAL